MASREKQYVITMAFRMACFISIFFVEGWLRWTVLAGAVFLPFVAVLFANQADNRETETPVEHGEPTPALQLTSSPAEAEVIEGELADDAGPGPDQPSQPGQRGHRQQSGEHQWARHDRVA